MQPNSISTGLEPSDYDLQISDVPHDGSCLFYSIALGILLPIMDNESLFDESFIKLFGNNNAPDAAKKLKGILKQYGGTAEFIEDHAAFLEVLVDINFRGRIVRYMQENYGHYPSIQYTEAGRNFTTEMESMRAPKVWGGQREVETASHFLNCAVIVYRKNQEGKLEEFSRHNHNVRVTGDEFHPTLLLVFDHTLKHYSFLSSNQKSKLYLNVSDLCDEIKQSQSTHLDLSNYWVYENKSESGCIKTTMLKKDHKIIYHVMDGAKVVSSNHSGNIIIQKLKRQKHIIRLIGHTKPIKCYTTLPNGQPITASEDNTIKVWDQMTGNCLMTLEDKDHLPPQAVTVLSDGKTIAIASNSIISFWDLRNRVCVKRIDIGAAHKICSLATLPNKPALAIGCKNGTIHIFDLNENKIIAKLIGHLEAVTCFVVLPDNRLASGSADKKIKLWNTTTTDCHATLSGHISTIVSLSVSNNWNLVSLSNDNKFTFKFWLSLRRLQLTDISSIFHVLQNSTIKHLNLQNVQLSHTDLPHLELFLKTTGITLTQLDVRNTGMSNKDIRVLDEKLEGTSVVGYTVSSMSHDIDTMMPFAFVASFMFLGLRCLDSAYDIVDEYLPTKNQVAAGAFVAIILSFFYILFSVLKASRALESRIRKESALVDDIRNAEIVFKNEDGQSWPTDYVHALLSSMSYRSQEEHEQSSAENPHYDISLWRYLKEKGWEVYEYHENNKGNRGYQAVAYINRPQQQLVIAHRGTDDWRDHVTNLQSVVCNNEGFLDGLIPIGPSQHEIQADLFSTKVIDKLRKESKDYSISFTGHSLGGWLAVHTAYLFSQHMPTRVITFDCPGVSPLIKRLEKFIPMKEENFVIINYLSDPNPVNTCNEHYGEMRRIYPKIKLEENYIGWIQRSLDRHSMQIILMAFDLKKKGNPGFKVIMCWPGGGSEIIRMLPESVVAGGAKMLTQTLFGLGVVHRLRKLPCYVYYKFTKKQIANGKKSIGEEFDYKSLTFEEKYELLHCANYSILDEKTKAKLTSVAAKENNQSQIALPVANPLGQSNSLSLQYHSVLGHGIDVKLLQEETKRDDQDQSNIPKIYRVGSRNAETILHNMNDDITQVRTPNGYGRKPSIDSVGHKLRK